MNKKYIATVYHHLSDYIKVKKAIVINNYLNGKSFDEISKENFISKGAISNIINSWISEIGIPDIQELREFSTIMRKSGITIKQCAQSFRFIQILERFGINDELDSDYCQHITPNIQVKNADNSTIDNKKFNGRKNGHGSTSRDNFYFFIETIYNYCKNQHVHAANIIEWIRFN